MPIPNSVADAEECGGVAAVPALMSFGGLRLDDTGQTLSTASGEDIPLTPGEFRLLQVFVRSPGRVLSRDQLLDCVSGRRAEPFDRSIDVLVGRLRRKIERDPKSPELIVTCPGFGYKFIAKPVPLRQAAPTDTPAATLDQPPQAEPAAAMAEPEPAADAPVRDRRSRRTPIIAAVIGACGLAIGAAWFAWPHRPPAPAPPSGVTASAPLPLPAEPSIAVLPFASIGGDAKQERLADGITADVITDLSRYRDLFVIARNSVLPYRGKMVDIREVGRDLGVRYVLEGSIQTDGDRVRVTAQLIEAASNSHVWSERYDRTLDDIFAVQNEVTQQIAAALGGTTGAVILADVASARLKPPSNLQAYDYYALGFELTLRFTKEENFKAEELLKKGLELDPNFAKLYNGLGTVYSIRADFWPGQEDPDALHEKAKLLFLKTIALDPAYIDGHMMLGLIYSQLGDLDHSLAAFERALSLNPNHANTLVFYGNLLALVGRAAEGAELIKRAFRLNPRYPEWYNHFSDSFYAIGQYDQVVTMTLRVRGDVPLWDYMRLAMSYAQLGRKTEATAALGELLRRVPDCSFERMLGFRSRIIWDETILARFLDGARKAGLAECATPAELHKYPKMVHLAACDKRRVAN